MNFKLHYVGSKVIEKGDFKIQRPEGSPRYLFFHFLSSCTITINNETISATPGSCILYTPGFKQEFTSDSMRINHDYIDFECFDKSIFDSLKIPLNTIFVPNQSKRLSDLISDLYTYSKSEFVNDIHNDYKLLGIFIGISDALHRKNIGSNNLYSENIKNSFEQLRLEIYENPSNLNIANLAKKLGFSPSYFNVLYKSFFNIAPLKDLDNARLQMAKNMLLADSKTSEIVKIIGFANEEYFYFWFKKHTGKTIIQFLKEKKG